MHYIWYLVSWFLHLNSLFWYFINKSEIQIHSNMKRKKLSSHILQFSKTNIMGYESKSFYLVFNEFSISFAGSRWKTTIARAWRKIQGWEISFFWLLTEQWAESKNSDHCDRRIRIATVGSDPWLLFPYLLIFLVDWHQTIIHREVTSTAH